MLLNYQFLKGSLALWIQKVTGILQKRVKASERKRVEVGGKRMEGKYNDNTRKFSLKKENFHNEKKF